MIRRAKITEDQILTHISFAAKNYWKYPEQYLEVWGNELTITMEYLRQNDVFIIERNMVPVGYYSIVELKNDIEIHNDIISKGIWLEHMFLIPEYIGKGLGTEMFAHLRDYCQQMQYKEVGILADPNAKGFYEKMGCSYIREIPSNIQGRTTPYLIYSPTI